MIINQFWSSKYLIIIFLITGVIKLAAQSDKELLVSLANDEQEAVNAFVMYPADTRLAILNVTAYPDALIRIESLQKTTQKSFLTLLANRSKEEKELIWDLTRYPGLISDLIAMGKKSPDPKNDILYSYPEVIHTRALTAHQSHFDLLREILELSQAAEVTFKSIIEAYPNNIQESFQTLKEMPEVLELLTENIKMTILAGAIYVEDPSWLLSKVDSLNTAAQLQNNAEIEQWINNLGNDPKAMQELKNASENYASENGYDDNYYDYETEYSRDVLPIHYSYHYPYWFGYPSWYTIPRWRCTPFYYDWGFYYSRNSYITIINIPSYHFMNWYFFNAQHHYYWPYLSSHFIRHHHHHHYAHSAVSTTVNIWARNNKSVINETVIKNDKDLPNRIKSFGKFEIERTKYNDENPGKSIDQKDFAIKNSQQYPVQANAVKDYEQKKYPASRTIKKPAAKSKVHKPMPKSKEPIINPKTDRTVKITPKSKNPTISKTPKKSSNQKPTVRTKKKPPVKTSKPTTIRKKKNTTVQKGSDNHRQVIDRQNTIKKKSYKN